MAALHIVIPAQAGIQLTYRARQALPFTAERIQAPAFAEATGEHMMGGWVYIMTNGPHGTLYIGVTANLPARVTQHRDGTGSGFCAKHGLTRLVYAEPYDRIEDAIAREKAMKKWKRQWKLRLIRQTNPDWRDLYDELTLL